MPTSHISTPSHSKKQKIFILRKSQGPIFDESFEFQINLPELALVRLAVLDDDYIGDEFIGQYTIPFECMTVGYQPLRDGTDSWIKVKLCQHLKTPVV
ncbi:Inactive phospholipase C-like protein 1 [Bulinus truncatus]|nr:Inactive phospholipase C-like protein 1 [Bulinus truncatus]